MKLIYGYCCEQGIAGRQNQDAMIFKSDTVFKHDVCVAAVCDGVGSFDGSGFASGFVVNFIGEWADLNINSYMNAENKKCKPIKIVYEELKNSLREKLWLAHKIICDETKARNFDAGTTVCVMLVVGGFYCIYNTGDSRAYEIGKNMRQLTEDHVANHNGKEMLSNCLGCFPGPDFKRTESRIRRNRTYMLASDGFYRRLDKAEAINGFMKLKTCEEMENTVKKIREYTAAAGERDDSTGIALKFI
jgi:serine/threonine protein phosphatase PrpC